MQKIDFKKELKQLYKPGRDFGLVEVPAMSFLQVDGHGDPNTSQDYTDAVEALYGIAYKIKFSSKKELGRDYVVPPLEGLWWAQDMESFSSQRDKSAWDWTMMIMQPDWISPIAFQAARDELAGKKKHPALPKIRMETYEEGLCVQFLHIGSYDDEGPMIARMHQEWMPANGFRENGKHHEIYLSDPRRVPPEKLRTIIRQPIKKAAR
jgi:hypothetical protein